MNEFTYALAGLRYDDFAVVHLSGTHEVGVRGETSVLGLNQIVDFLEGKKKREGNDSTPWRPSARGTLGHTGWDDRWRSGKS